MDLGRCADPVQSIKGRPAFERPAFGSEHSRRRLRRTTGPGSTTSTTLLVRHGGCSVRGHGRPPRRLTHARARAWVRAGRGPDPRPGGGRERRALRRRQCAPAAPDARGGRVQAREPLPDARRSPRRVHGLLAPDVPRAAGASAIPLGRGLRRAGLRDRGRARLLARRGPARVRRLLPAARHAPQPRAAAERRRRHAGIGAGGGDQPRAVAPALRRARRPDRLDAARVGLSVHARGCSRARLPRAFPGLPDGRVRAACHGAAGGGGDRPPRPPG